MYNPMQSAPTPQPSRITERRRPAEPGSISEPGFQPKRQDDKDKHMPPEQLPGALPREPGASPALNAQKR